MVDIHSHVLPGIDDGSPSLETSLEMLRMAAQTGTTDIVATPHKNLEFPYDERAIGKAFQQLSDISTGLINVHLGCDFHLSVDNIQEALASPGRYTINGKGYLMVELPDVTSLSAVRSAFNRMLQHRIIPIITHPERNLSIQKHMAEVTEWVHDGCRLQVTAQSLTGRFGRVAQRSTETLLDADLVHFVASDAHDTRDRVPVLKQAFDVVAKRWGTAKAETIFIHNPAATLIGKPISGSPKPKKASLFASLLSK
jgi:protein-tyrosine phosphatase